MITMAPIRKQLLVLLLVSLLSSTSLLGGTTSAFSISQHRRSERNTDLAEALAILQRQRRRVGVEDFLNSQRMLEDRPLTLEDVSDWLNSRPRDNDDVDDDDVDGDVMMRNVGVGDDEDSWMPPEMGRFKDFDLSDGGGGRDVFMAPPDETPSPIRMKASENEVNDIFTTTDGDSDEDKLEKKVKEELVNPKGDAQPSALVSSQAVFDTSNPRNVLNSLTDEEIRVLVKAVGKLQQQGGGEDTLKVKKSPEISELSVGGGVGVDDDDVVVSEPVSQEELKSVFEETDGDGPVSKETIIVEHKEPGQETPRVFGQQIVSEKLPDDSTIVRETDLTNLLPQVLEKEIEMEEAEEEEENEAAAVEAAEQEAAEEEVVAAQVEEAEKFQRAAEAAEAEAEEEEEEEAAEERISPELLSKYLLMEQGNKLPNDNVVEPAGAIKRTAKRASGLYSGKEILSNEEIRSLVGDVDFKHLDTSSLIQAFVVKILSLQNEIDGLRFKNRLEDLENDELTDALNEATVGQREGSVSNQEWSSLQHAIEIEQALQDLKNKETSQDVLDDEAVSDDDVIDDDSQEEYETKRGEPWKRSQDDEDDMYSGAIASRSSLQDFDDERNADIERLLKSSYLMKSEDPEVEEDEEESPGDDDTDYMRGDEDEPIASLFLSHADRCPAIRLYSNNCELADLYNLPVDFEARALCNLHEMCYACGHSLSVTQTQCDLVYRAAVSSLCHQKEVCVAESEIFLRTMKLKTRFIPYVQPTCRSRCTAQFMGMF